MGVKELVEKGSIKIWKDVFDPRLDDKAAPDLGDIVKGKETFYYSNPEAFFKRTYMTSSMKELIYEVAETLRSGKSGAIFLLTSLFGGGKTHTQLCLYHAFSSPEKFKEVDEQLAAKVAEAGKPIIIVMDGSRSDLVPHPNEPFKAESFSINTIWGMLAYRLGAYAKIKHLDSLDSPVPGVNLLKEVLSEPKEPILILMDEIVHYVFNMSKSGLKDYGDKVMLFLDYLSRAIEDTPKAVLVASVQAEYRVIEGQKQLFEEDMFKGYASNVLRALSRESTKTIVPVSPDDVVKVLNKNIFEFVPEDEALKARDKLYSAYREKPDLFGVESDWQFSPGEAGKVATARETYPFHPKYVEVLEEFVTRNKDLQKTRDAIRITRKVVRRILRGREDASFIMPWHIDLRDPDIRNRVLTESRREFRDVANRDIVDENGRLGSINVCSKPQLALRIATVILLKTYTYETFKEPLKVFPDLKNIAIMTYEPETFSSEDIQDIDIKTILDEMYGNLPHLDSEDGRYWFTPYPSVIEYVEKRAEEKLIGLRLELYKFLVDHTKNILTRKEGKKGIVIEQTEIFSERNTTVIGYGDDVFGHSLIQDTPAMKLVVLIKPEVNEEEVRKIILMAGESGRRTYRNTVAVVCPSPKSDFNELLRYAAKITAAKEVLGSIAEYYTEKEIRELQQGKLKNYIQKNENFLNQQILLTLTRIAYPERKEMSDDIKWFETTASSSIISQVEAGLKNAITGPKIKTDFSFDDLNTFLKQNQNWDLVEGSNVREVREIVNIFYTLTSAPFTTRSAIERAIREGLERLDIGLSVEGKLYWKKIGPEDGAEIPESIKDSAEILPYRLAAEKLKEKLLSESGEKVIEKKVYSVWYEVEFAGRRLKLEELSKLKDWQKIVKEGTIVRQERVTERGFILKVAPSLLVLKPEEEAQAIISVEPIEKYSEEVELKVDKGSLEPKKGKLPLKSKWQLGTIEPGDYIFNVFAYGADGANASATLSVRVESLEEELSVKALNLEHENAKLLSIEAQDILSLRMSLDVASKLNLKAKANVRLSFGENVEFNCSNVDVKLVSLFVQKFEDLLRVLPSLRDEAKLDSAITFDEPVVLDKAKIASLTPLYERVSFKLRVKRNE
ncbi:MAG: DUF499 domain-containing protein [Thermoproteota archaeon]